MNEQMTQIFKNDKFGSVRVVLIGKNQEPYFNLSDACVVLGYTRKSKGKEYVRKDRVENIASRLDISGLSTVDNRVEITKEIDFNSTYITEDALYDLVFESDAAGARDFRHWVTKEVLPTIRKHGVYITDEAYQEYLNDKPQFELKLKKAHEKIEVLRLDNEELEQANELLTNQYNDVRLMYQNCTNEVAEYVNDQIHYSRSGKVKAADLYNHYCRWCQSSPHYQPYDRKQFEELLLERMVGGHSITKQDNYYIGIEVSV